MKRILVQAGHMRPLQPGHETQTGADGEAELVARIQKALVAPLDRDADFHGVPMPGLIDDNVDVDGAVFLHADGALATSARGFSLDFPAPSQQRARTADRRRDREAAGAPAAAPDNNTSTCRGTTASTTRTRRGRRCSSSTAS